MYNSVWRTNFTIVRRETSSRVKPSFILASRGRGHSMDTVWCPDTSQTQDVIMTSHVLSLDVTLASAPRSEVLLTLSALLRALCAPCARVKDIARDQLSSGAIRWDTARVKITKYTRHGIINSLYSLLFSFIIWKAISFKHCPVHYSTLL